MAGLSLMREEEALMDDKRCKGSVLMAVGEILLYTDLLLLVTFVSMGLKNGSQMWTWWVIGEGILGIVSLAVGAHMRGRLTD